MKKIEIDDLLSQDRYVNKHGGAVRRTKNLASLQPYARTIHVYWIKHLKQLITCIQNDLRNLHEVGFIHNQGFFYTVPEQGFFIPQAYIV